MPRTRYEYDAIVVGARAAGASTAMLLARRGHRVLLVDRAQLPSDIARGHFVYRHAPRRLRDWGLLDRILGSGTPAVTQLLLDVGDFPLTMTDLSIDGVPWGIGPRRRVLDGLLLEAAAAAGVDVQDEFAVDDVLLDDGRVSGIRGRASRGGAAIDLRAPLTVGADGLRSRIAQAVRAPTLEYEAPLTCWYFSYWSDVPTDGIELRVKHQRAAFVFPTSDKLTAVFVAFPIQEFARVRDNPEASILAALDESPELGQRVREGRRQERMYGTSNVPYIVRKAAGPGWALVGDAACHKDPMLALGVCHALQDADLLAPLADDGLSGRRPLDHALAAYDMRRRAATTADCAENLAMARLEPPTPEVLAMRAALRERPDDSRLFALAAFDVVPRETFFNPQNLARIVGPSAKAA